MFKFKNMKTISKVALKVAMLCGLFVAGSAMADTVSLQNIASNVDSSVKDLAILLSDISLIAGIGFIMASFFKFHQHKLNPTQVPLSQGITLLIIGAGLTFFPTVLPIASKAVFGSGATISTIGGSGITSLIS